MLVKILLIVAALVGLFAIFVATRPSEFQVTRSTAMAVSPSVVFPLVNHLREWESWSPWENLDSEMQRTFEGPPAGEGAVYAWVGNSQVGEGRMTIEESRPNELIRMRLEFFKPMAGVSQVEFTFLPVNEQTEVTWNMRGENNFVGKAMCLFMDMDKMCGSQFETGLAQLKARAESVSANGFPKSQT